MAKKLKSGGYACTYCSKKWTTPVKADACRDSHDLLYLRISRDDLNRLHNYLYSGNRELVTESLVNSVKGLMRRATVGKPKE